MKTKLLMSLTLSITSIISYCQDYVQFFDGADTSYNNSIIIKVDTATENIWQIGEPQKVIFDAPSTTPNSIVTDTINNSPINNVSSFTFGVNSSIYD